MTDFLKRVLNAQIVMSLLAGAAAIALRVDGLVSGAECVDVLKTCLWSIAIGAVLRDGVGALASKAATQ